MDQTPTEVKELVQRHVTSMDHLEVLMKLYAAPEKAFSVDHLREAVQFDLTTLSRCLGDLVGAGLVRQVELPKAFQYAPRRAEDARAVDALAIMYNQRPVTLVKLVYDQPPKAVQSFADAFRLRDRRSDK